MLKKIKHQRREGKHYFSFFECSCGKLVVKRNDTRATSCGCKRVAKPEYINSNGYKLILINGEYVYEHRYVMERHINRKLQPKEEIHHINKIKTDNNIKNLKLCKDSIEHSRYNKGWIIVHNKWFKKCPQCKLLLNVEKNFYRCKKQFFFVCKECCKKNNKLC